MAKSKLTAERLRELVSYDPRTGIMRWKSPISNRVKPGDVVGCINELGYWQTNVATQKYLIHRLIWLYVTGQWPKEQIDHIDGDRANNRLANLREISSAGNKQNQKRARKTNITGLLGVGLSQRKKPFVAKIQINGITKNLGRFDTAQEAYEAYVAAKRKFHPFGTL